MKYKEAIHKFRKEYLLKILESVNHNRYQAAKITGLHLKTIQYWVKKYNFPPSSEENFDRHNGIKKRFTYFCKYCLGHFTGPKSERRKFCSRSCNMYHRNKQNNLKKGTFNGRAIKQRSNN